MRFVGLMGVSMLLAAAGIVDAAGPVQESNAAPGGLSDVLDRATAYIERFYREFGSMVAEERYEQRIRPVPGAATRSTEIGPMQTVLRSDFLLVEVPGQGWVPFRDVVERDGKPVGDRQTRLADLFLGGARDAFEQGRAVIEESARHNIGNVDRNINVPTLALTFLMREHRDRFAFDLDGRDDGAVVLAYTETSRPTVVRSREGGDLPVEGRFWIDEEDGTVLRTEMRAFDTRVQAEVMVAFRYDDTVASWVPARMEESYQRRNGGVRVIGEATYSRFRRFQVTTEEEFEQ
jgi:hypothetical protein